MNSPDHRDIILDHYKRVARNHGLSSRSTMEDDFIRSEEISFILDQVREIGPVGRVLDLGCGNGFLLQRLREEFPEVSLLGRDLTPELVELACSRNIKDCDIREADASGELAIEGTVDVVVTERSIINILNREDQHRAFMNIANVLKPGGWYIHIESYQEPLDQLNQARREVQVSDDIEESVQNKYLTEAVAAIMEKKHGMKEVEGVRSVNHLSSHFYITRVFHKMIKSPGSKIRHDHFTRFFTRALPPAIGNYSPILFRVFRKS